MMNYKTYLVILILVIMLSPLRGQDNFQFINVNTDDSSLEIKKLNIDKAILLDQILNDKSPYSAFINAHRLDFDFEYSIKLLNKRNRSIANANAIGQSVQEDNCRSINNYQLNASEKYLKKNQKLRFFTSRLIDEIFILHSNQCEDEGRYSERVRELAELMLSPGKEANLQFIGKKTDIFSEEFAPLYDFKIYSMDDITGSQKIIFEADLKPEHEGKLKRKTIVKNLKRVYDLDRWQLITQEATLKFKTPLHNFDIDLKIDFEEFRNRLVPSKISYSGSWIIIPYKAEYANFNIYYSNYR